jgi:hypothetical protein
MSSARATFRARVGDRLVIRGHHVGEVAQDAEILEVLGPDGSPPYLVRWEDGRVSRLYPSSDAYVQHFVHDEEPTPEGPEPRSLADEWEAAEPPRDG